MVILSEMNTGNLSRAAKKVKSAVKRWLIELKNVELQEYEEEYSQLSLLYNEFEQIDLEHMTYEALERFDTMKRALLTFLAKIVIENPGRFFTVEGTMEKITVAYDIKAVIFSVSWTDAAGDHILQFEVAEQGGIYDFIDVIKKNKH